MKNRWFGMILSSCTLLFLLFSFSNISSSQTHAAAAATYRGDINEDGQVNIFDLLEMLKVLGNPAGKTDRTLEIADVDASGGVNIFDLLRLLKVLTGAETPGTIFWGPVITELSQESAAAGDTIGIVVENLGENVTAQDIKAYIGPDETGVLELSDYTVKVIVPQGFAGGEVKLVIAADTTNTKYLGLLMRIMIEAASGGLVEHPCGASVEVKAGALNADIQISVSEVSVETANELGILEDTSEVLVELEPSGLIFNQPVTVSLPMPSDIDSTDILEAVYYSETDRDWVAFPSSRQDYEKKLLYVETDHFTVMKARKWSIKTAVVQGIDFVSIPGGTFQMGQAGVAEPVDQEMTVGVSEPVHQVTVSAFQMGRYEITNSQYATYLNTALAAGEITATTDSVNGAKGDYSGQMYIELSGIWNSETSKCWISYNGTSFSVAAGKENWPVVFVTWYGSKAFALKYGFDLPREAEWEYAARGGKGYEYGTDDGTISIYKANYNTYVGHLTDVGSYPVNPFGLYDLAGNVWEWCNDWYGEYSSENATDPQGPSTGSDRVIRGGGYAEWDKVLYCSSAHRAYVSPSGAGDGAGFRVVRRGATVTTHSLQGSILESGSGLPGVSVHITGAGVDITLTTGSGGSYSISGLADGAYTVTPAKSGYTFSPASTQVTVSGSDVTVGIITATASGGVDTTVVQGITFVSIPGGTFQMGSTTGESDEQPVHQVTVSAFQMGRYEITQAQYQAVIGSNPSYFTGDLNRPVEQVSWYDAVTFCNKLSEAAGLQSCYNLSTWECDFTKSGFRLPTEAEWEYACRAGTTTNFYTGDSEADMDKAGWYNNNSHDTTHAVGGKQASAFGLHDMHGNVFEWCNDWYGDYSSENANDPQGPSSGPYGSYRIKRGGEHGWDYLDCRSARREANTPDSRKSSEGFRIVCR
ncbi:MAG TPA: SUMF1/EgtB/PvdO family nonheme iron enzyme [archaeon]|nr:SUMF1/EgtB/PvdO family nonheme iron enzyme [archaeon]